MEGKYMGIDYGAKRVGIAISDNHASIAFPRVVFENNPSLVKNISEICGKEKVVGVVIGDSKDFQNESNPIMREAELFIQKLQSVGVYPIYREPEFLTSVQAEHIQGSSSRTDASAAALILQSFLDRGKNNA